MSGLALLAAAGCAIVAAILYVLSRRIRTSTGLPAGKIIYTDTGAWRRNEQSLYSERHHLAGKPDYLVRQAGQIIPVEVKSGNTPAAPHEGHVLQLAAYCLLVEETLGQRPRMGIIQYTDRQFEVPYTDALKQKLLGVLNTMRQAMDAPDGPHRSHAEPRRCRRCGLRENCGESLGAPDRLEDA